MAESPHTMMPDLSVPFVAAIYECIESGAKIDDAVELLLEIESRTGIRVDSRADAYKQPEIYELDDEAREQLHAFLDESRLVISGGDLMTVAVLLDRKDRQLGLTWRQWGEELAVWANARKLVLVIRPEAPRPDYTTGPWNYLDFYMDVHKGAQFEKYSEWARVVLEVVKQKSQRYPFKPATS